MHSIENTQLKPVKLLAFMAVNNETGVMHDIEAIAAMARQYAIDFLVDAVAAMGKVALQFTPGISALVISAHKFHGPAGVGALVLRSCPLLNPLIVGGSQQRSRRAGTLNVASIAAMQAAMNEYIISASYYTAHFCAMQARFEARLRQALQVAVNGSGQRAPNVSNLYFPTIDGESLLIQLDQAGLMASHGSACQAGAMELSHVVIAMYDRARARNSLRFSFGRNNTLDEIDRACSIIEQAVEQQRKFLRRSL